MGGGFQSDRINRDPKSIKVIPSLDFGALKSPKTKIKSVREQAFEEDCTSETVSIPKSTILEIEKRLAKLENFQQESQLNTERTLQNLPIAQKTTQKPDPKHFEAPLKNVKKKKKK